MGADASKNNHTKESPGPSRPKEKFGSNHNKSTKKTDDAIIFILADWCGHCSNLKNSGEIEELKNVTNRNDVMVFELDDKHPETKGMMEQLESTGFPTIAMVKDKKIHKYDGERTASAIMDQFNKL